MAGDVDGGLTPDYHGLSLAKNQVQWRQDLNVVSHSKHDHTGIMGLSGSTTKRQMMHGIAGMVCYDFVSRFDVWPVMTCGYKPHFS